MSLKLQLDGEAWSGVQTDPALYRQLREQITRFFLRGGNAFCLKQLEKLAHG